MSTPIERIGAIDLTYSDDEWDHIHSMTTEEFMEFIDRKFPEESLSIPPSPITPVVADTPLQQEVASPTYTPAGSPTYTPAGSPTYSPMTPTLSPTYTPAGSPTYSPAGSPTYSSMTPESIESLLQLEVDQLERENATLKHRVAELEASLLNLPIQAPVSLHEARSVTIIPMVDPPMPPPEICVIGLPPHLTTPPSYMRLPRPVRRIPSFLHRIISPIRKRVSQQHIPRVQHVWTRKHSLSIRHITQQFPNLQLKYLPCSEPPGLRTVWG